MAEVPTTFHLFPDLPVEIRRKIWAAAIDHPRLIECSTIREEARPGFSYCFTTPILIQICHESRDEARLRYHHVPAPVAPHLGPLLYLNPSSDILLLSHRCLSMQLAAGTLSLFDGKLNSRDDSAWKSLRAIALCASNATRLIEPLCLQFPSLDTVFLLQDPEKLVSAYLVERRVAEHLGRRREGRGDGKIPSGLRIKVITLEVLRRNTGGWEGQMGCEAQAGGAAQCGTCLLQH